LSAVQVFGAAAALAPLPKSCWNAAIAEWLAGLFVAPPSAAMVVSYRQGFGAAFLDALADEPGCAAPVRLMRAALGVDASEDAIARAIALDFTRLFDGVGGWQTVPPYENAHAGRAGHQLHAAASDMNRLLRQFDVSIDAAFREPSDHLSVELALLAWLMRHDADVCAQASLLDRHLLVWTPGFSDRCGERDRGGFYAGSAQVLTAFLIAQRAALRQQAPIDPNTGKTGKTGVMPCRSV
jgi:TorA-specific chaperone